MTNYGNPNHPCAWIKKSRELVNRFSTLARAGVEVGLGDPDKTEAAIGHTRSSVAQTIGGACSAVCSAENRCIMKSLGPDDPLNQVRERTELQEMELLAKISLANLERTVGGAGDTEFLVVS
jgi:hypothetical protein